MADQKVNIDVNINTDGLSQLPQYKAALDSLRTSIENLNKEIQKNNTQIKETVNWGTKIKTSVKEVVETYKTFKEVIENAGKAFEGWVGILSAAFTIITNYGPQILDFLDSMFQSEKTREAAQALRDYKEIMESYTENIAGEISQLGMLLSIANDENLSKENRIEALKKLNNLSPEYLNNLTLENLKTKEGKELLDEYLKSLNRKAMEEAVQAKRTDYVKQRLELKEEYDAAKADEDAYKTGKKKNIKTGYTTTMAGAGSSGTYYETNSVNEAYDRFATVAEKDKKILKQIDNLNKDLADSLIKYAPKSNLNPEHNRSYWETQLNKQQDALNKLDATGKDFEAKSKTIKNSIKEINKTLSSYAVNETKTPEKKKQKEPDRTAEFDENRKAYQDHLTKQNQAFAEAIAKKVALEHNNYTAEQTALQNLYNNKLITQEQYQQESEKLEEKYHVGVADIVKRMNVEDLARVQKQQQELIGAQQQKGVLDKDQHKVDKAILPANKLAAEKQLITDKYNFEIQKAAETGQDTAAIRMEYEQKMTEATKQYEQERKDFAVKTAQEVSDKAFSIISNNIKAQSDARIKGLENDKTAELSNKNLTSTQKQAIEQKYKQKEDQVKLKAFKDEQKLSLAQAVINGALAITKATAQTGVLSPFVIPGIIAETAIQVASILAQKPPAFAKGGHFISDGRGALLPGYSRTDNTNAYLRSGEAVVVSEAMRNPWARNLVSAINVAHGGRDFSIPNTSRGYAVGGIFTDGGNANRYYNQPVNDVKDLANTLAYQMINNFPPIYVDVKDVNNQQNILAQTVNRVNL